MRPVQPRRIEPAARAAAARHGRSATTDAAFIADLRLRGMILRMLSLNSLNAFAQEIGRRPITDATRGVTPVAQPGGPTPGTSVAPSQRTLEVVPPQPVRPTPRGSLLDLRV